MLLLPYIFPMPLDSDYPLMAIIKFLLTVFPANYRITSHYLLYRPFGLFLSHYIVKANMLVFW